MKQWMKAGIGIALLVLAIAAGTGAYAMRGGDEGSPKSAVADESAGKRQAGDAGGATMAMCVEGVPDCNDMIVEDGGGGGYDACPPDTACIEPWLMDPPVCADGLTIAECFPDGVPAGYDCVEMESFPVQVACKAIYQCGEPLPMPMPYEIDPMPAPDVEPGDAGTDGPAVSGPALEDPVEILPAPAPGELVDPIDPGTTIVERVEECPPLAAPCVEPGVDPSISARRCLPPDCAVSSDGSVACPEPCVVTDDPMAGIAQNECVEPPVDCVTYEDGSVACPGSSGEGEGGCVGGPAVDCAPIGDPIPCEGGPAVDCGPIDLPLVDPAECIGGPAIDCPAIGETQADRDAAALE